MNYSATNKFSSPAARLARRGLHAARTAAVAASLALSLAGCGGASGFVEHAIDQIVTSIIPVTASRIDDLIIPDRTGPLAPVSQTVEFSGVRNRILAIGVEVRLTHTSPSDVSLLLIRPDGLAVVLFSGVGGTEPVGNFRLQFQSGAHPQYTSADLATQPPGDRAASDAGLPSFGLFPGLLFGRAPNNHLDDMLGEGANGTWQLVAVDRTGNGLEGRIERWHLSLNVVE